MGQELVPVSEEVGAEPVMVLPTAGAGGQDAVADPGPQSDCHLHNDLTQRGHNPPSASADPALRAKNR